MNLNHKRFQGKPKVEEAPVVRKVGKPKKLDETRLARRKLKFISLPVAEMSSTTRKIFKKAGLRKGEILAWEKNTRHSRRSRRKPKKEQVRNSTFNSRNSRGRS